MEFVSMIAPQPGLEIDLYRLGPVLALWSLAILFMLGKMRPGLAKRLSLVFWGMIALAGGTLFLIHYGALPEMQARSSDYGTYSLTRSVAAAWIAYYARVLMPLLGVGFSLYWVVHMVRGWFHRPHGDYSLAPSAGGRQR